MEVGLEYIGKKKYHVNFPIEDELILGSENICEDYFVKYRKKNGSKRKLGFDKEHALIKRIGDEVYIEDLGSLVGTWVNDLKIGEDLSVVHPDWKERNYATNWRMIREMNRGKLPLFIGDRIEIGKEVFRGIHVYRLVEI